MTTSAVAQLLEHARRCMQHGSLTAARSALDRARRLMALEARRKKPARPVLTLRRSPE